MARLRAILILLGFLALTLPLMPVQFVLRSKRLPWIYHRLLCRLLGIKISIIGTPPAGTALLVSNHVSWLDIPVLSSVLPVSFIAKREVGTWPLFGWMAKLQRTVFINRESRHSTGNKRGELAARLQQGDCLVLFPEGTSSDGTQVLPFKSSYFGAVEGLGLPVVPVTISYQGPSEFYAWYGDMDLLPHLWAVIKSGPIKVRLTFHPSLEKLDRKTMARNAEATIRSALGESH
jgi:lyso-ornithine lipid O-acyltransferase